MKILFLAPQPFFQERGTPIAVRLALNVLAKRALRKVAETSSKVCETSSIDLITYHEGENIDLPGVRVLRIWAPRWLTGIRPGISIKKLLCDVIFTLTCAKLLWDNRKSQYELIHAVEESVFIAALAKLFCGIPYIYDMDSSLALQVTEKWPLLTPLKFLLELCEKLAIQNSLAVVPVCDALATVAINHGSKKTQILYDISLLNNAEKSSNLNDGSENIEKENLKNTLNLSQDSKLLIYIGNLESYQGIDLLIESFATIASKATDAHLVVIGGASVHLDFYRNKVQKLNIHNQVHIIGPRPVSQLNDYLKQGTILVSPRIKGNNTPMKIYSYLHSGIPILATNLPTHTQVLDNSVSILAEADPKSFGESMLNLLTSEKLRKEVGSAAFKRAEENYTFEIFEKRLNSLYDSL